MSKRIRTLIVDDSSVVRRLLTKLLSTADDIEVVGTACDPFDAREKIAQLRPDVMTLDIEMPRMDGLTFLSKLLTHFPLPVIVVSSVAQRNSANALRALRLGAVEVVAKPGNEHSVPDVQRDLMRAVRVAARANVKTLRAATAERCAPRAVRSAPTPAAVDPCHIIAFGSSTGGVRALETLVTQLPSSGPPVVSVQHIPKGYVPGLVKRLDTVSQVRCLVAEHDMLIAPGTFVISPGDSHLRLIWGPRGYRARLDKADPVNHHRPSVDVLFHSVAECAKANALGVILTGMGNDGAEGLLAMRKSGAHTIAEAEESCIVFGMPKVAIERGAAAQVIHLHKIVDALANWARTASPKLQTTG